MIQKSLARNGPLIKVTNNPVCPKSPCDIGIAAGDAKSSPLFQIRTKIYRSLALPLKNPASSPRPSHLFSKPTGGSLTIVSSAVSGFETFGHLGQVAV